MADNVVVSAGTGTTIAADEVTDGTLGTVKVQIVKIMDGTLDGTAKMKILAASTAPAATDPAVVVAISPNSVNANGQATMANSAPVVLASNQSAIPISGPNANGSAAAASSAPVTASTEDVARIGIITETAPATDTASSGLNGRLQRIAQRITSLIALLPAALGTGGGLKVDGSGTALPVSNAIGDPALSKFATGKYVTVAASQTAIVLQSSAGATGDYISGILVIPATTSPGNILLLDNATSITVFTGGTTSVSNLVPFFIPLGAVSASGAWKLTTGANVSAIGIGKFS